MLHIRQRIDVEGADDARVQALEIEHPDVAVQTGHGFQHMTALLGGMNARIVGAHGRRNDAPPLEFGQVQKIEGRDARRHAIGGHTGEPAARPRELHEIEPRHDLVGEPRIGTRIERERCEVVPVVMDDFRDPVMYVAGDRFPLAEDLTRDGVERILIHAHESSAQQVDAIQHQTAGNRSLAAAKITLRLAQADRTRLSPQGKRVVQARGDSLQDGQVEIDYIPTHQHIGIEFPHAGTEEIQCGALICAARGTLRHGAIAAIDDQNFVNARSVQGNRQQTVALAVRLNIERQHTRLDIDFGRPERRIRIHPRDTITRHPLTLHFTAALDTAIDQVTHREAHISLECLYIGRVQSVAYPGNILRSLRLQPAHRSPRETAFVGGLRFRRTQRSSPLSVDRADVEVRTLPVVAHQECIAALQPTMNVYDGPALSIGAGDHAIVRLKNETT